MGFNSGFKGLKKWLEIFSFGLQQSVIPNKHIVYLTSLYIYIYIYIQQDATLHNWFISGNCSTRFGWYLHPSSGAQTTVSTESGTCHTVTAICRYRWRVGTGLSVLWVAHATHNTLKPVPTLPRLRQIAVTMWQIPDAVDTVVCAPDDGWTYHPKRVAVSRYK